MNFTIFKSPTDPQNLAARLLDKLSGKTLIIVENADHEANWRLNIIKSKGRLTDKTVDGIGEILKDFVFLKTSGPNFNEYGILSQKDYVNIILENVWVVYRELKVPEWLALIKTNCPSVRFIGINMSGGETYLNRIDSRYWPVKSILPKDIENALNDDLKGAQKKEKKIFFHTFAKNINNMSAIHQIEYCGDPHHPSEFQTVATESFLNLLSGDQHIRSRSYCALPKAIKLLTEAAKRISTAMIFYPIPDYGARMTFITSQIKELLSEVERDSIDLMEITNTCGISLKADKSLLFFEVGGSGKMKRYINWYAKPRFDEYTFEYAVRSFKSTATANLAIEGQALPVSKELLEDCVNVVLFGSNRFDLTLINQIRENATDDLNIIMTYAKDTADESNVAWVVSNLDEDLFNVIRHDLSP